MATMQGVLLEQVAQGQNSNYLNANPRATRWRSKFVPQTLASIAYDKTEIPSGQLTSWVHTVARTADLISNMFVKVQLPGLANIASPTSAPTGADGREAVADAAARTLYEGLAGEANPQAYVGTEPYYTNGAALCLLKNAHLVVGSAIIEKHYGEYLFLWDELAGESGKRLSLSKASSVAALKHAAKKAQEFYIPLHFSFTASSGQAFPLVACQFHKVEIHAECRSLTDCIIGLNATLQTVAAIPNMTAQTMVRPLQTKASLNDCVPLEYSGFGSLVRRTNANMSKWVAVADTHIGYHVIKRGIYLDVAERKMFAQMNSTLLIKQLQTQRFQVTSTDGKLGGQRLNLNHPVSHMVVAVQAKDCQQTSIQTNGLQKQFMNFGSLIEPTFGGSLEPLLSWQLFINGYARLGANGNKPTGGKFFRTVIPYQQGLRQPESYVYLHSFADECADKANPSGHMNFSRIDNATCDFVINPAFFQQTTTNGSRAYQNGAEVIVYAENYNTVRLTLGMMAVSYTS
jgi:hypothetical protein